MKISLIVPQVNRYPPLPDPKPALTATTSPSCTATAPSSNPSKITSSQRWKLIATSASLAARPSEALPQRGDQHGPEPKDRSAGGSDVRARALLLGCLPLAQSTWSTGEQDNGVARRPGGGRSTKKEAACGKGAGFGSGRDGL